MESLNPDLGRTLTAAHSRAGHLEWQPTATTPFDNR
jgi:hypothetical protein